MMLWSKSLVRGDSNSEISLLEAQLTKRWGIHSFWWQRKAPFGSSYPLLPLKCLKEPSDDLVLRIQTLLHQWSGRWWIIHNAMYNPLCVLHTWRMANVSITISRKHTYATLVETIYDKPCKNYWKKSHTWH